MAKTINKQVAGDNSIQLQIDTLNLDVGQLNELMKCDKEGIKSIISSLEKEVRSCTAGIELEKLEKINLLSIFYSSTMPWSKANSTSYLDAFNDQCCIDPYIKEGSLKSDKNLFSSRKTDIIKRNCIILGDAGGGKTFIMKKMCVEKLEAHMHALYISSDDWKSKKSHVRYVMDILNGELKPVDDLFILIDGIDEIFATDHAGLGDLIDKASRINSTVWLGCRTDYFEHAKCFAQTPYQQIYITEWEKDQADQYVMDYAKNNEKILTKYNELQSKGNIIECFYSNPLRLSMLLYIIENDPNKDTLFDNNIYLLYEFFFRTWISNELTRLEEKILDSKDVLSKWQMIARGIYDGSCEWQEMENHPVLTSIVKVAITTQTVCQVSDFLHRSFIEFLLAKKAVDAMLTSTEKIVSVLINNNRADVDFYVKQAFQIKKPFEKNRIVNNLILAYKKADELLTNGDEKFYVQNQIVYYLTRMNSKNVRIGEFIKEVYFTETRQIMKQGIAYGAANIGLLDIALDYAKKMDKPNSIENRTNRAWTLIFYGDLPDEDPLYYEDEYNVPWQRSKEARLRRLQGNKNKDRAFRMFDLCILHGFYESRGWEELSYDDLQIIKGTETDIDGYSVELKEFLKKKQQDLISKYCGNEK